MNLPHFFQTRLILIETSVVGAYYDPVELPLDWTTLYDLSAEILKQERVAYLIHSIYNSTFSGLI
jgi:hypothetical protein